MGNRQTATETGLESEGLKNAFTEIYDKNLWLEGSGVGSRVEGTVGYREYLIRFIREEGITGVVDFGCGDWRFSACIPWGDVRYVGVDIVDRVVRDNIRKHGCSRVQFLTLEEFSARSDPTEDLFILKDVIQHLSYDTALKVLAIAKGYPYALITNDYREVNTDCADGGFRPLNITAPPFACSMAKEVYSFGPKRTCLLTGRLERAV